MATEAKTGLMLLQVRITPGIAANTKSQEEARKNSLLEVQREQGLVSDFQAPELGENTLLVLRNPDCDTSLWQSQEMNTSGIRGHSPAPQLVLLLIYLLVCFFITIIFLNLKLGHIQCKIGFGSRIQ